MVDGGASLSTALSVDTTTGRKAIDPHIYGINFADEALAEELRLPVRRWGGNATSRYNYQFDAYNAGHDWYFENLYYENGTAQLPDGSQADKFVEQDRRTGTDTVMTVPMSGWTTAARNAACGFSVATYGPQKANDAQWRPDCGNGVKTDGTNVTGNDPKETSVPAGPEFTKGWVEYLKRTYGAADDGGVGFYNLDNEPDLWWSTHRDVHPEGTGYDEMRDSTYATAAAIKDADPLDILKGAWVVVRRLGVPDLTTTVLTLTLTGLAADSTTAGGTGGTARRMLPVLAMFLGALAGAWLFLRWGLAATLGPALTLLAVTAVLAHRLSADDAVWARPGN
ncbi:glycoside hydrolase family 44 protein [Streptomyces sp. BRA346]|uniref:glycoside hydrolase family 44 protein n=1 Tax=Streptomyces sp. BRA346 TaxID=2878199 RepID=UPI0040645139